RRAAKSYTGAARRALAKAGNSPQRARRAQRRYISGDSRAQTDPFSASSALSAVKFPDDDVEPPSSVAGPRCAYFQLALREAAGAKSSATTRSCSTGASV